jgi:hypothetical protein
MRVSCEAQCFTRRSFFGPGLHFVLCGFRFRLSLNSLELSIVCQSSVLPPFSNFGRRFMAIMLVGCTHEAKHQDALSSIIIDNRWVSSMLPNTSTLRNSRPAVQSKTVNFDPIRGHAERPTGRFLDLPRSRRLAVMKPSGTG